VRRARGDVAVTAARTLRTEPFEHGNHLAASVIAVHFKVR
jgi:hypothetical protein